MANAKGAGHAMQLKPITVPMNLVEGYKFIKWDDVSLDHIPLILIFYHFHQFFCIKKIFLSIFDSVYDRIPAPVCPLFSK